MSAVTGWPRDSYAFHADELGDTFAGLIRRDSGGLPVPGVLGDVTVSAVASSWDVAVSPFIWVARVGTGVRLSGESATEHVSITPAAGSVGAGEARIDLVCWDTDTAALVVVEGTPAPSPTAPSDGGLVALAEVRVNAGDGQVIGGQITEVFARTGLATGGRKTNGVVARRSVPRNTSQAHTVTFPPGLFTEVPNVQLTVQANTRAARAVLSTVTASGFSFWLVNDASSQTMQVGAQWRAEQL